MSLSSFLLLLSFWALTATGNASFDAAASDALWRRRGAVSSTATSTASTASTTDDRALTRPPRDDDAINEESLLQGRGPKEDKTMTTTTLEPTPGPEMDASVAPSQSPSPPTPKDLGPVTDDDRPPRDHDDDTNNTGASSATKLLAVNLVSFRVAYDPSSVSLDHVVADYEDLLWTGFGKEYPNVHNVSLWNASAVFLYFNSSSKVSTATTTLRGRVWFRGSAPHQVEVARLQRALVASRDDENVGDNPSDGGATSPSPTVTAGAIGGAIGFVVGAVLAVLVGRRCWNRIRGSRETKGLPKLPFTGADLSPPSSGPDRHVQFRFHSGTQAGATDSADSGEEGSMETNVVGEDEEEDEEEVPSSSPPIVAAAPESAAHDASASSFEMMLASGRSPDRYKVAPSPSEAAAAAAGAASVAVTNAGASYRMGAGAVAALSATAPRPLPPSHRVWEQRRGEPRRRSAGGGGGFLQDDDEVAAGAIGWTVSPSFQFQQARSMSP